MKRYDPGYLAAANIINKIEGVSLIRAHDLANTISPLSDDHIFSVIRRSIKRGKLSPGQLVESKNQTSKLLRAVRFRFQE